MKTTISALCLLASGSCIWTGANAQSPDPELVAEVSTTAPSSAKLKGLQLGGLISQARYREPGLMQVEGPRLGLWASYDLPSIGLWTTAVQGQLHSSSMHYSSTSSGELDGVPDHEFDLRWVATRALNDASSGIPGDLQWRAYWGLGWRVHFNDLRGITTAGHIGYRRLNQRVYVPLGLQVNSGGPRAVTGRFELTPALHGTHKTFMTDVGGTQDATVSQKSRGWAVQVGWQPFPGWGLSAYHRRWSTSATESWTSTVQGVTQRYVEPLSRWDETGVKLSRQF